MLWYFLHSRLTMHNVVSGMIVGWYLHKTKCQIKMPYWLVAVGWPASLIIIASLIFGMVDGYFEVWPTAFYVSVGHTGMAEENTAIILIIWGSFRLQSNTIEHKMIMHIYSSEAFKCLAKFLKHIVANQQLIYIFFNIWLLYFADILYYIIFHIGWGVALAWISIACCCGYGGLIKSGLSYRGLLPLSRLTYCAYLVHPTIMMYTSFLLDGPLHLENSMVVSYNTLTNAPEFN